LLVGLYNNASEVTYEAEKRLVDNTRGYQVIRFVLVQNRLAPTIHQKRRKLMPIKEVKEVCFVGAGTMGCYSYPDPEYKQSDFL